MEALASREQGDGFLSGQHKNPGKGAFDMATKRGKQGSSSRSTGIFSSLRGGMKNLAGQGGAKKKKMGFLDVLLWVLVAIMAIWVIYQRFG